MGDGEVCVAMVSEVEGEKTKQKRDHEWVMDVEPVAKKQAKEGELARNELELVTASVEQESCGKSQLEVSVEQCLEVTERQICESKETIQNLDCAGVRPSAEQSVKVGSDEMGLDPSGEKQSSEVLNDMGIEAIVEKHVEDCLIDIKLEPSTEQPVKEWPSEMETEACDKTQQTDGLNESKPEVSVQQSVKECLSEKHLSEGLIDKEIEPIVGQPGKDCLNEMDHERMQILADIGDVELEPCIEQPVKECPSEMETEALNVKECPSDMEAGSCGKMESTEPFNESEPVSSVQRPVNECSSETPTEEACVKMELAEALDETEPKPSVLQPVTKCTHEMEFDALIDTKVEFSADLSIKECKHETLIEPCIKKEASNDDICSEVSNPIVSPRDNSSFQTVNSQPDEKLVIQNQVICGEITSGRSGNSSSEGCSSQEEKGTELTSHVVIEAPKDAITSSGVRKITFKFSKRKEDFDSQPSASAVNGFVNGVYKIPRLTHISEQGFHERGDSRVCPTSMKAMPVPDNYLTSVQKLLSTGILDGAKVKYISTSAELIGIVKDGGYLCGCDTCNFSNVLRAHEFEEHAGGIKTSHPNKHIYMENGKSIYRIIQVMKKTAPPLSRVDEVIRDVAGSSVNEELLQVWKARLQSNMDMAKTDNSHLTKLMDLYHPPTRPVLPVALAHVITCEICSPYIASIPLCYTSEDGSSPFYNYRMSVGLEHQTFINEAMKERKCLFKKPKSYASSVAVEAKRSAEGGHKKRDNDLHRLLFMPNGIPDGTALGYYARGNKVLDGYKQGIGIVCSHCDDEISPSQFEAHAGWAVKRQPYRNIYVIPNGMALHDIALLLANGQSITTSNSDDMCAVCGDGGKLIICHRCPRAFHADCLELEGLSSEDWECPYCRDGIGSGRKAAAAESRPIVIRLSRVVKAREYEAGGCVICSDSIYVLDFVIYVKVDAAPIGF
ncbi:zinc finger, PHD-type containing protein [Tanacetum coccineum]